MAIQVGDRLPDVTFKSLTSAGIQNHTTADVFGGKKVVLFAVPGAFTPTCSDTHLPGFQVSSDKILAKGVDTIACVAVNDVFVLDAWGKARNIGDDITLLSDGNGDFANAADLTLDLGAIGLGTRSKRFAMIVDDGVVSYLGVEPGKDVGVSSADAVLAAL
ncbi:MAG: peroxiredoxin [Acidobacteriota bacterium]